MSKQLKCWSCKAVFTLSEHGNCDGCCWKCGVEIDLDEMDIHPADQQGEPVLSIKRYERDAVSGHCDVEIALPDHKTIHHDHGPNLAEAVARLAYRIAKFHKLIAPTLASHAQPATAKVGERAQFEKWFLENVEPDEGLTLERSAARPEQYELDETAQLYRGWQARAKLNTPQ
ncbi:hypothetical protein [Pseudomonas syringae group sp. J248-6]|uniref:hypothetical protein n=1 Tax=Pseudomonas syringae group sp. J248-6 TaxID=3079590 RepID=UPI00290EE233|nr:hypothetical protein [Pseudomonas syringae group sp. J248-6]MDU8542941.1 hypothetical protein [Pseudomonas syringae group sp. J248-6]